MRKRAGEVGNCDLREAVKPWTKSHACGAEFIQHHANCHACRNSIPFRQSLFALGRVSIVEFACPLGYTADTAPRATSKQRGALPGTELKRLLSVVGIVAEKGCNCDQTANAMDMNGPQWCRENIDSIVSAMGEEAHRRNLPFVGTVAKRLVWIAIWTSEKRLRKST